MWENNFDYDCSEKYSCQDFFIDGHTQGCCQIDASKLAKQVWITLWLLSCVVSNNLGENYLNMLLKAGGKVL